MAKPRAPRSRMVLWAASGITGGALLLGFFTWHILSHAPQEGRDAFADNRTVVILLPEGEVHGGIMTKLPAAAEGAKNPAATPGISTLPPGEGLKAPSDALTEQTS